MIVTYKLVEKGSLISYFALIRSFQTLATSITFIDVTEE